MDWHTLSDILANLATVIALVLGGAWTYILFVRQRVAFPRLQTIIRPEVFDPGPTRLIRVEVDLENLGSAMVKLRQAELRLRQVVPLPDEISDGAQEGYDPIPTGQTQVTWPMLAGRQWAWRTGELEIEPGESETHHAEFFVPHSLEVVEFYLFVANARKLRNGLGWSRSQLWHVPRKVDATMAEVKLVDTSKMVPLQGRQEKQQQPQQQQQQAQPKAPSQEQSQRSQGNASKDR